LLATGILFVALPVLATVGGDKDERVDNPRHGTCGLAGHEHPMAWSTCFSPWFPGQGLPWSSTERREKVRIIQAISPRAPTKPNSADEVWLRCFQLADVGGGVGRPGRSEEAQLTAGWENGPDGVVL
jgi:hypothetical protein